MEIDKIELIRTKAILKKAYDLLKKGWNKQVYIMDEECRSIVWAIRTAVVECGYGEFYEATPASQFTSNFLCGILNFEKRSEQRLIEWNDQRIRTHFDVLRLVLEGIDKCGNVQFEKRSSWHGHDMPPHWKPHV